MYLCASRLDIDPLPPEEQAPRGASPTDHCSVALVARIAIFTVSSQTEAWPSVADGNGLMLSWEEHTAAFFSPSGGLSLGTSRHWICGNLLMFPFVG